MILEQGALIFFFTYDSGFLPALRAIVSWVAGQMGTLTSSFLVNSGDLCVSFTVCLHQRRPGAQFLLEGHEPQHTSRGGDCRLNCVEVVCAGDFCPDNSELSL